MGGHQQYMQQQQQQHGYQVNPHSMSPQTQAAHHSGVNQGMPMHSMPSHSQTHYPPSQTGHLGDSLHIPRVLLLDNRYILFDTLFFPYDCSIAA